MALPRRSVVVRWAPVGEDDPTTTDLLGSAERERLATFRSPADRRSFVAVRSLLRRVVAEAVGCDPQDVALTQRCPRCDGAHGRPVVEVRGRPGPAVTMARTRGLVVVAVGRSAVGVDVETDHETAPGTAAAPGALRDWVRREAVLKAIGSGVDQDPSPVQLGPPTEAPRLTGWTGPGRRPSVRIADLAVPDGHIASVARLGRSPLQIDQAAVDLSCR